MWEMIDLVGTEGILNRLVHEIGSSLQVVNWQNFHVIFILHFQVVMALLRSLLKFDGAKEHEIWKMIQPCIFKLYLN